MSRQSDASARLRDFIAPAFTQLSIAVPPAQMDEITELVGGSMVGAGRFFHTPEHVIHVGSGGDALSILAAFFHDLVYLQVDQGVGINVARHIAPFVLEKDGALRVRQDIPFDQYPFARAIMGVFGVETGGALAFSGQNEFLSAMTAGSVLSPYTNLSQIVQVAACIEATIPFRAPDRGLSAAGRLLQRLTRVNQELKMQFTKAQLDAIVRRAVKMANQDVSNFGGESATRFLKNTWELVPEINPMLRSPGSYTVEGYRQALQKMEKFFAGLNPAHVFQQYEGEPDAATYARLCANAQQRVEEARLYFRLKLMSLGMLEALSGTLGKNLGLPILMGELSNLGSPEDRVEKFLPRMEEFDRPMDGMEQRLFGLMEKNPEQEAEVGLKSSPLTAFLVKVCGVDALLKVWPLTMEFFNEKATPRELLEAFPADAVGYVSDAVSLLLQRRAHRIHTFVGSLVSVPPA